MQSMYVGSYTETQSLPLAGRDQGVRVTLHRLDPNTYLLSDDCGGIIFNDFPIPARVGDKVMQGDFAALAEASPEVAAIVDRPHFQFVQYVAIVHSDGGRLRSDARQPAHPPTSRR